MAGQERFQMFFDKKFAQIIARDPAAKGRRVATELGEPAVINHEFDGISAIDGDTLCFERQWRPRDPFYPVY